MRTIRRSFRAVSLCLAPLAVLLVPASAAAQGPSGAQPAGVSTGVAPATAPLDVEAREAFLAGARIVRERPAPKGTTNTKRVTLNDGTRTHDASVQTIDEAHAVFQSNRGTELNFKDSWRFNVAAYRIDRLLGINMVPATVERRYNGRVGSFTWWVDDVLMDEQERYRQKRTVPNTVDWNQQMWLTRLFDQLIANMDRNLGNLLVDSSYNIWMIDHSRAFRLNTDLKSPENLSGVDRGILARLRAMDRETLRGRVGAYLNDGEIDALLERRDRIVAHYERGGPSLLFDRRARCCN